MKFSKEYLKRLVLIFYESWKKNTNLELNLGLKDTGLLSERNIELYNFPNMKFNIFKFDPVTKIKFHLIY